MATYAVGDLQGHLTPLLHLLERVHFDPGSDRLWLVGDLVNRGPESLEALRFVRELRSAAVTVLGNHDLHLLAVAEGGHPPRRKDTFDEILAAPDRPQLMAWLRQQKLAHYDPDLDVFMAHAGAPFVFSLEQALARAREVEQVLAGPQGLDFLKHMYGNQPAGWQEGLAGMDAWRVTVNYFTRMRFIDAQGRLDFQAKEGLDSSPPGYFPWFERLHPDFGHRRIIFGHWAALEGQGTPNNVLALDTGCCWGRCMTLMRLEDEARFTYDCSQS